MINTILFDLDGTLLPMDMNQFMQSYFYHMGKHFDGWIDSNLLAKYIWQSTEAMIKTNDGRTKEAIFMEHFENLINGDIEEYKKHFDVFYETLFSNVQKTTYQSEAMIASVKALREKGYSVVVATNPLFPYRANLHRIRWAGMDPEWFSYISSYEKNLYTKPYLGFYQEVLNEIDKMPEECLMVGNDVSDDLPAGKLGIKTFLVTDCLINDRNLDITSDYKGTYQDFFSMVEQLPRIN